jgi:Bifunctional DNA primase/polymerase, N-terminal
MTAERLRQAAHDYAARRLPVFPCVLRDKIPITRRGFHDATTNPATIERWWRAKAYNIGIPTGAASGVWVVDTDPRHDGDVNLRRLEAEHGPLPHSWQSISGSGGTHDWFKYTGPIQSSAGRIAPGIDVRCDGGYIIAPPSIHECGRAYAWSVDSADEIAEAPEWLIKLARKPTVVPISERAVAHIRRPYSGRSRYGQAALDDEIDALSTAAPGTRNATLNRAAFSLFQLVSGGELQESEVERALIQACEINGLMEDPDNGGIKKIIATIRSGARAGLAHPRSRSGAA